MPNAGNLPITIRAGTLPAGAVYNAQTYFDAIVARMTATVSQGNVLWGQLGGSTPAGPLPGNDDQSGLWFGNPVAGHAGYWNDYNSDAGVYLPIPVICGQYINGALKTTNIVCGAVTANQTLTTPDESGTIALTADLVFGLGTQTKSGSAAFTADWSLKTPIYVVMSVGGSAGTVVLHINHTNDKNGMIQDFWLENAGGPTFVYQLSMTDVYWFNGGGSTTPPSLSAGQTGKRVIDHVRVYRVGGYLFGVIELNYIIGTGVDTTSPSPLDAVGLGTNVVRIDMSDPLQAGSLLSTDFTVVVNGATATVVTASCSGTVVTLSLDRTMGHHATATVLYTGSDMKSLAGNTVAHFGPVDIVLANGGIHNEPMP